jgi:hypothetical protein
MANQSRSIWEIRFYAMMESLDIQEKIVKNKVYHTAMDTKIEDIVDEEVIHDSKVKMELINKLQERFRALETTRAKQIFLMRDCG